MTNRESQIPYNRVFRAKDWAKMLELKELTGGIMERFIHPTLGVCYIVRWYADRDPDSFKDQFHIPN